MKPDALCMLYATTDTDDLQCLAQQQAVVVADAARCVTLPGDVVVCDIDPLGEKAVGVDSDAVDAVCEKGMQVLNVCGEGMVFVKSGDVYACVEESADVKEPIALCMSYTDNTRSACSEGDMLQNAEMLCTISKQMRMLLDESGRVKAMCGTITDDSHVTMCKFFNMDYAPADDLNGLCGSADEVAVLDKEGLMTCVSRETVGDVEGMPQLTVGDVEAAEGEEALLETEADMEADEGMGAQEEMLADLGEEGTVGPTTSPAPAAVPAPSRPSRTPAPRLVDDQGLPVIPQPARKLLTRIQLPPFGTKDCQPVNWMNRYGLGSASYSGATDYDTYDNKITSSIRCGVEGVDV